MQHDGEKSEFLDAAAACAQPLDVRLAHLEGAFDQVGHRLESLERTVGSRFNQVDSRFNRLESRFEPRFSAIDQRFSIIDQRFNWLIGIVVASWISTIVTVLFHH